MENPVRRRGTWWQYNDRESSWYEWKGRRKGWEKKDKDSERDRFLPPPSRWRLEGVTGSEPFYIYLFGVLAAIAAFWIAIAVVPDKATAVLGPVLGLIGAFAGHAAGHSSALRVMKEGKAQAPEKVLPPASEKAPQQGSRQDPAGGSQQPDPNQ